MQNRFGILALIQLGVFVLSFFSDWYSGLVLILFLSIVVLMLDNLGKGVVLREIIALHSCFVCLVMPLVGYTFFTRENPMARLWVRFMPIPEHEYFGFTLPAMAGFVVMLCWPLSSAKHSDNGIALQKILEKARNVVQHKTRLGVILLVSGTVIFQVSNYLPTSLQFFFLLFYFASFAGFLYVYYSKNFKYRKLVIACFVISILVNTLNSGMFTIIAYMGLTLFSFFFLGKKARLWKKLLFFFAGIFLLLVVQLVKPAYRAQTWGKTYQGNKATLFGTLFVEKLTNFNVESADVFFPIYYRTNQGFNVSLVMRRFPKLRDFDHGSNLMLSLASAFVPRFLWPDKPEAGGKYNMKYYVGITLVGWSTNVGPLGEAYGSFGPGGGIVFMALLGFFIRLAYRYLFVVASRIPLVLFWLPVLFYQVTYSAETDTLQIMNFLIKSAFFIWLLYKIKPDLFELRVNRGRKQSPVHPALLDNPNVARRGLQ